MRRTKVSVIIPFLNRPSWLVEAVNSVKQQTFTSWELILIDDGSDTEASSAARQLADHDKIFYLEHHAHANRGVSASRNLGAKHAKGNYLAFLDSDDCWLPGKLAHQLNLFSQYPSASMVCESSMFWHNWQADSPDEDYIVQVGAASDNLFHPPHLFFELYPIGTGAPPCPSGIMVTRSSFEKVNGFEESFTGNRQLYEDQGFLAKMYLNEPVFVSSACNNLYRKHADSITEKGQDRLIYSEARGYFLQWLMGYVAGHQIKHRGVVEAIAKLQQQVS